MLPPRGDCRTPCLLFSWDATLPTPGLEPSQGLCLHWELPTRVQTLWTAVLLGAAYSWPGFLHSEATFLGSLGREVLPEGPRRHFASTLTLAQYFPSFPPPGGRKSMKQQEPLVWGPLCSETSPSHQSTHIDLDSAFPQEKQTEQEEPAPAFWSLALLLQQVNKGLIVTLCWSLC